MPVVASRDKPWSPRREEDFDESRHRKKTKHRTVLDCFLDFLFCLWTVLDLKSLFPFSLDLSSFCFQNTC